MTLRKNIECFILIIILSTFYFTSYAQSENTTQPEVTTSQGTLRGVIIKTQNNRTVSAFLGIPYGQPPIGNLRFANPLPAGSWNGTLDATVDGTKCTQSGGGGEDCLYLNVYIPKMLPEDTNSTLLPVMVFIHGGAFILHSATTGDFGPLRILDKDVVLVIFNYRLGPFGFLSTGDEVASGNWGLKDQVLALRWVQDNIEYFGGDPDQVTLFGQSAGSTSTHLLSLSNATIGLFHRFITQSGSALGTWAHRPRVAYSKQAYKLGNLVGCSKDTSDALINCLRTVNSSDILDVYSEFYLWYTYPVDPWGPTDEPDIDGAILLDSPMNLYAAGQIRDLPWIVGTIRDEGVADTAQFYENEALFNEFFENFDAIIPTMLTYYYQSDGGAAWVKAIKSYYFNDDFTANSSVLLANLNTFITDSHFLYPTYNAIRKQYALAKNPQYFYRFDYRGTYSATALYVGNLKNYGVTHSDELVYIFPCEEVTSLYGNVTMNEEDREMIVDMVELWTSFAINGTPTSSALNGTAWLPYSESEENYLRIGGNSGIGITVEKLDIQERMEFWDGLYASLENSAVESNLASSAISRTTNFIFVFLLSFSVFLTSVETDGILKLIDH